MSSHESEDSQEPDELTEIRQELAGLRFGEVKIVAQDGVVVQLERTERVRLSKRNKR